LSKKLPLEKKVEIVRLGHSQKKCLFFFKKNTFFFFKACAAQGKKTLPFFNAKFFKKNGVFDPEGPFRVDHFPL